MSSQKRTKIKKKTKSDSLNNNVNLKISSTDKYTDMETSISRYKGSILGTSSNKMIQTEISNNNKTPNKNVKKTSNVNTSTKKLKSDELQKQLDELKAEIAKEKQECLDEVSGLNIQLNENQKNINELSKNNTELMTELKNIQNEVDANLKIARIFKVKKEEMLKEEKQIKNSILVKDEEITNETKRTKIFKNEIKKFQKLLKESEKNTEIILSSQLDQLNQLLNILQLEIKNLKKIASEHGLCTKIKTNILTQKNILDNEYQFMLKKLSMYENNNTIENEIINSPNNSNNKNTKSNSISAKPGTVKKTKNKTKLCNVDKSLSVNQSEFLQRNKNIFLNKKKDENSIKKLNKITLDRISTKLSLLNEYQVKTSNEVSNSISECREYNSNKSTNLFSDNEFGLLGQIIPECYLDLYKRRYDNLEAQKLEAGERFNTNNGIKKQISAKKDMIDFSELQLKERSKVAQSLKCEVNKYKKIISELNIKVNEINKKLKIQKNILAVKNKENQQLKKNMEEMKNEIEQKEKKNNENDSEVEDKE